MQLLLGLPPELRLLVVSHLSLREIPRLRQLCREMHNFVDAHESAIAGPTVKYELERIREELREINSHNAPQTLFHFIDGLFFWYRKKGRPQRKATTVQSVFLWAAHLFAPIQHRDRDLVWFYEVIAARITKVLVNLDDFRASGREVSLRKLAVEHTRRTLDFATKMGVAPPDQEQLDTLFRTTFAPGFEAGGPSEWPLEMHDCFLTACRTGATMPANGDGTRYVYDECGGECGERDLHELLGLPTLPPTKAFAYTIRGDEAGEGGQWVYDYLTESVAWGTICPPMHSW